MRTGGDPNEKSNRLRLARGWLTRNGQQTPDEAAGAPPRPAEKDAAVMEIRQQGHRRARQSPPPPRWQAATASGAQPLKTGEAFWVAYDRADVSATVVRLSPPAYAGEGGGRVAEPSGASQLPTWQRRAAVGPCPGAPGGAP